VLEWWWRRRRRMWWRYRSVGLSALGGSGVGWWRHARGGMERRRVEVPIGTIEGGGSLQWMEMDVSRYCSSSNKLVATQPASVA
jgi:hypothetical protein